MNKVTCLTFGTVATGMIALQLTSAATAYNPSLDFSLNSNPNGVWSYGYSTSLGGSMTLHQEHAQLDMGLYSWRTSTSGYDVPGIFYNPTESTIVYTPNPEANMVWNPHQTSLHPGPNGEFSILRFTPPEDGRFQLQGQFSSVDQYYGAQTDVHILRNGASIFEGYIAGPTSTAPFNDSLQLAVGDQLDFVVGIGLYSFGWDSTGLDLVVTLVPEPSALGLLSLGLLLLRRFHAKP